MCSYRLKGAASARIAPQHEFGYGSVRGARKCLRREEAADREGRDWDNKPGQSSYSEDVVEVSVTLRRAAVPATPAQALWVAIRNSNTALSHARYVRFYETEPTSDEAAARWRCFLPSVGSLAVGLFLGAILATTDSNLQGRKHG